jgi:hypothetical protein
MSEITKLLYWADVSNSISNVSIVALCAGFVGLFFSVGALLFAYEDFDQRFSFRLAIICIIWELFFIVVTVLTPAKTVFYAEASIKIEQELKANADNPSVVGALEVLKECVHDFGSKIKNHEK